MPARLTCTPATFGAHARDAAGARLLNDLELGDADLFFGVDGGSTDSSKEVWHSTVVRCVRCRKSASVGEVPVLGWRRSGQHERRGDATSALRWPCSTSTPRTPRVGVPRAPGHSSPAATSGKGKVPQRARPDKGGQPEGSSRLRAMTSSPWVWKLPKLRGSGRVVVGELRLTGTDKTGVVIDARINVNSRLDMLNRAIVALRERPSVRTW